MVIEKRVSWGTAPKQTQDIEESTLYIGRNSFRFSWDWLYPRRCPVCHEVVFPKGALICPPCLRKITFVKEPVCACCGKPVLTWEEEKCYDCSRRHRSFRGGVALMTYDTVGKNSMIAFKYKGRQEYAEFYGQELWSRYGKKIEAFEPDVIIPVPVHVRRRRLRGYNQAEKLAGVLSRCSGIPMRSDLLVRVRETEAQKQLGADERQKNLESALRVIGSMEDIRRVILVDDIYTTGSTMEACTRVLMEAGAEEVMVASVCIGSNL